MENHHNKVFLIGGAPGTGKTTLGTALAARLGVKMLTIDDLVTAVIAVTTPETHPGLHATRHMLHPGYFTNSSLEQLKADATLCHQAAWPIVVSRIQKYANSKSSIVIEGWHLRPEWMAQLDFDNVWAGWLMVAPAVLETRERNKVEWIQGASDPEHIFHNFMARSLWYNDLIKAQATTYKMPLLHQTGSVSVDELCDMVLDSEMLGEHMLSKKKPAKTNFRWFSPHDVDIYGGVSPDLSGLNFRNASLSNACLGEANLRNTDLFGAFLTGAVLSGADLRGADLRRANLDLAWLDGALIDETTLIEDKYRFVWQVVNEKPLQQDLRGKDLRYIHLENKDLSDMDLSEADFTGSRLSKINFRGRKLNGARLAYLTQYSWYIDLHNSTIDSRTQMDNKLRIVWQSINKGLPGKNLKNVNLSWTCLQGANFAGANLSDAKFFHAKLMGANFSGANLQNADLRSTELQDVIMHQANLQGAILVGASLHRADLSEIVFDDTTKFNKAKFDSETIWPVGFDPISRGALLVG